MLKNKIIFYKYLFFTWLAFLFYDCWHIHIEYFCSTGEYCIESNKPVAKGKMLVFVDHGTFVSVTERIGGFDAKCVFLQCFFFWFAVECLVLESCFLVLSYLRKEFWLLLTVEVKKMELL